MESSISKLETLAELRRLVRTLPSEILNPILKDIFGLDDIFAPSETGGRPFEVDNFDTISAGSDDYLLQDRKLSASEHKRNKTLTELFLFRDSRSAFDCHAWLSPGRKLGCTVRIQSSTGLYEFAKVLSEQPDVGSYVRVLVVNAGHDWLVVSRARDRNLKGMIRTILEKLPSLKALYLRHEAVNAFLAVEQLSLLSNLDTLSLSASQDPSFSLKNIPRNLTTLSLSGVHLWSTYEYKDHFPRLRHLTILPLYARRVQKMPFYTASPYLRTLPLDNLDHKDVRALLQAVGPQLSEIYADVDEQAGANLPTWFFKNLVNVTCVVLIGYCDVAIFSAVPENVTVFKWFPTEEEHLRDTLQILELLSKPSTLPKLKSVPYFSFRTVSTYGTPPIEHAQVEHRFAIRDAAQVVLKYLRDERGLTEADSPPHHSVYKSLWKPAFAYAG